MSGKSNAYKPTPKSLNVPGQLCKEIPGFLVAQVFWFSGNWTIGVCRSALYSALRAAVFETRQSQSDEIGEWDWASIVRSVAVLAVSISLTGVSPWQVARLQGQLPFHPVITVCFGGLLNAIFFRRRFSRSPLARRDGTRQRSKQHGVQRAWFMGRMAGHKIHFHRGAVPFALAERKRIHLSSTTTWQAAITIASAHTITTEPFYSPTR